MCSSDLSSYCSTIPRRWEPTQRQAPSGARVEDERARTTRIRPRSGANVELTTNGKPTAWPSSAELKSTSTDRAEPPEPGGAMVRRPLLEQVQAGPGPWLASVTPPRWNRSRIPSSYCSTIPRRREPTRHWLSPGVRVQGERGEDDPVPPEERSERRASHDAKATNSVSGSSNAGPGRSVAKCRGRSRADHQRQASFPAIVIGVEFHPNQSNRAEGAGWSDSAPAIARAS